MTTTQAEPVAGRPAVGPVRRWIIHHDDSKVFLFGYVGLSVVLTLWVSLFWLIAMVGLHFALEWVKKRHDGTGGIWRTFTWVMWDIKLDALLIVVAMVLVVYSSVTIGAAGAGGLSRLSLFGFRFSKLGAGLRGVMPLPFKDLVLATRIIGVRKIDRSEILRRRAELKVKGPSDRARARRIAACRYPWQAKWSMADRIGAAFFCINVLAILVGFYLAEETPMQVLAAVAEQLHPWPGA